MNKKLLEMQRHDNLRLFEKIKRKVHHNNVPPHPQNTLEHEIKKFEIGYNLLQEGCEFVSESQFVEGGRIPDICALDVCIVYEICISETESYFKKKIEDFPVQVRTVVQVKGDKKDNVIWKREGGQWQKK